MFRTAKENEPHRMCVQNTKNGGRVSGVRQESGDLRYLRGLSPPVFCRTKGSKCNSLKLIVFLYCSCLQGYMHEHHKLQCASKSPGKQIKLGEFCTVSPPRRSAERSLDWSPSLFYSPSPSHLFKGPSSSSSSPLFDDRSSSRALPGRKVIRQKREKGKDFHRP